MEHQVLAWIAQYGYPAIFCLLMFGIVGLPVPDETLLTFTGYLVFMGIFQAPARISGGLAGQHLRHHHQLYAGPHFRAGADPSLRQVPAHHRRARAKAHAWFERVGHWGLTFGYFVPGRPASHRLCRGHERSVEPHQFALFAYSGACPVGHHICFGLGYFLGERWQAVSAQIRPLPGDRLVHSRRLIVLYLVWRKLRRRALPRRKRPGEA